jgi:hypothetical protein
MSLGTLGGWNHIPPLIVMFWTFVVMCSVHSVTYQNVLLSAESCSVPRSQNRRVISPATQTFPATDSRNFGICCPHTLSVFPCYRLKLWAEVFVLDMCMCPPTDALAAPVILAVALWPNTWPKICFRQKEHWSRKCHVPTKEIFVKTTTFMSGYETCWVHTRFVT